jgi:hypothetical protein
MFKKKNASCSVVRFDTVKLIAAQIFVEVIAVFHIERFLKADQIRADFVEVLAEARDARFAIKGPESRRGEAR